MTKSRIESARFGESGESVGPGESVPPALLSKLAALVTRAAAMGLLGGTVLTAVDDAAVARLAQGLQRHGIGFASSALEPLLRGRPLSAAAAAAVGERLDALADALEASAAPATEWPAMRAVFGDDALAGLIEISASSLRRYAAAERDTPDAVAARLHWLALVTGDLAGGYNDFGIRRWFERPRAQLDGMSPRALLGSGWDVDGAAAQRLRQLAAALTGAQPLAA